MSKAVPRECRKQQAVDLSRVAFILVKAPIALVRIGMRLNDAETEHVLRIDDDIRSMVPRSSSAQLANNANENVLVLRVIGGTRTDSTGIR